MNMIVIYLYQESKRKLLKHLYSSVYTRHFRNTILVINYFYINPYITLYSIYRVISHVFLKKTYFDS